MLFDGQVALITGAGSGICEAAALAFARDGARGVVLAGRRISELERVADLVADLGATPLAVATEVSLAADVERLIRSAIEKSGRLDAAFNNAGIEGAFAPITDLEEADFDRTVAVNLKGVWLCCREEMRALAQCGSGGAIINTSSWLAQGAFPGSSIY
jgi:NAD(P)-dependent dehydrogenase (short-subunit alcohol dehydrogenase family)